MSASIESGFDHGWIASQSASDPTSARWDELPTDGSHAWLGLVLLLASSVVAIRGICWLVATAIRLAH
jgi:hypothetical protein